MRLVYLIHKIRGCRSDRSVSALRLYSFIAAFHVKPVENAMRDGRQNDARDYDNSQAAVKRVQARKELAAKGNRCIHRPHPAEEH